MGSDKHNPTDIYLSHLMNSKSSEPLISIRFYTGLTNNVSDAFKHTLFVVTPSTTVHAALDYDQAKDLISNIRRELSFAEGRNEYEDGDEYKDDGNDEYDDDPPPRTLVTSKKRKNRRRV
jgi:hypothetical protein